MIKKFLSTLGLTIIISALLVENAFAITDLGQLSYWYSNESSIGYWENSTVKITISRSSTCEMPSSTLQNLTNYAFSVWAPCESLTGTQGTSSDYNCLFYGITRTEANNMGIPADAGAATSLTKSLTATATYLGLRKYVYSISKATICYIWDNASSTFPQPTWDAISAHEFGHACGYFGHDTTSSSYNPSLMNPLLNDFYYNLGVTSPQARDINHMSGV